MKNGLDVKVRSGDLPKLIEKVGQMPTGKLFIIFLGLWLLLAIWRLPEILAEISNIIQLCLK